MNRRSSSIVCALAVLIIASDAMSQEETFEGVAKIKFLNYENCIELKNDDTRVVLGHHVGGRILEYSVRGNNILYLSPEESNWTSGKTDQKLPSSAGRFDVGPEIKQVRGRAIWQGPWTVKPTGDRSARMTSPVDPDSKMQVIRDIELDSESSRLTIIQTVKNVGDEKLNQGYWSRTFAKHGGVAIVPCNPKHSRMPDMYYSARSRYLINMKAEDPAIRRVEDFLLIEGPTEFPKLGFDACTGWVAYQTRDDQLFVKRYPVFPDRKYAEPTGINLSIFYPKKDWMPICEIEPIGPLERLKPNESASFTVEWWLLDRPFPESGNVDPKAVEKFVSQHCPVNQ